MSQAALLQERVETGAAAVRSHYGPDCLKEVDHRTVDISDPLLCVCGQIGGHFAAAMHDMKIDPVPHGFLGDEELSNDQLTAGWKRFLQTSPN